MTQPILKDFIIYKIVCLDDSVDLCYVGSTCNWKGRSRQHQYACNNESCKFYNLKIYKMIRENGGWKEFKMIQIATREQISRRQAEQVEEEYRVELKANMNQRKCFVSEEYKQEYRIMNKEAKAEYDFVRRLNDPLRYISHECECGGCYVPRHKAEHLRSLKHLKHLGNS